MDRKKIGNIGEDVACTFLKGKGHRIVCRNYWKKWGEIDVVSEKDGVVHFVEVKAVSRLPAQAGEKGVGESSTGNGYRPEENVHPQKLKRLHRAIQSYLIEKNEEREWQIDVLAVFLDMRERTARCRFLENVI